MSQGADAAVVVLTTVGRDHDAAALSRKLVASRVCACVNIIEGVRSIYRWKNGVEEERETLMVIKTSRERVGDLEELLRRNHPYEVPEFVVIEPASLSPDYARWLLSSTSRETD